MSASSSLKLRAYKHIRRELLAGKLPPGQRISPEISARQLGMSQTPVREAIGLLESDGLVEQVPGQGCFVRMPRRREFGILWDVRIMLESNAAARAARRASRRQVAELARIFARIRALSRQIRDRAAEDAGADAPAALRPLFEELALCDASFHVALLRAADVPPVHRIVDNLQVLSQIMRYTITPPVTITRLMAWEVAQHWRILRAVKRQEPTAARAAMRDHLRRSRKISLDGLRRKRAPQSITMTLDDSVRRGIRTQERGWARSER
jgi:DNA-binding GntR family transcriptional regulator